MSYDSVAEVAKKLTPEEIEEIKRAELKFIHDEVHAKWAAKREAEQEDYCRPMFRRKCSPAVKAYEVEVFMGCDLYDYLCERYDEEDMHEFLWGDTPWEEYMAQKKARLEKEKNK